MRSIICLIIFCFCGNLYSQNNYSFQKLVPQDRDAQDEFGRTTAICGDYIIVGALNKIVLGNWGVGAAYIFKKQSTGKWEQIQKLGPDKNRAHNYFGGEVAMSQSFAMVAAFGEDNKKIDPSKGEESEGAVYVYKRNMDGNWMYAQKLAANNKTKWKSFGLQVAITEKFMAITASEKRPDKFSTGVVFIYEQDSSATWRLTDTITSETKLYGFARKINLSDSNLIVSAHDSSETTHVYNYSANKKWQLKVKIGKKEISKIKKITDKELDPKVWITDNYFAIGTPGDWDIYKDGELIKPRPTTDSVMDFLKETKDGKVIHISVPNKKRIRDSLKISPAEFKKHAKHIESDLARKKRMAGAGSVYIYKKNKSGNWVFHQIIQAKDRSAEALFGECIGMSDSVIVIGAVGDGRKVEPPVNPYFSGAAYIFKLTPSGKWIQTAKLTSEPRGHDKFGFSVSVYKKTVVVGSRFETEDANEKNPVKRAGAVYVYEVK